MGLLCSEHDIGNAYAESNHTIFPKKKRGGDGLGAGKRQAVCPAGPRCRTTPPPGGQSRPGASGERGSVFAYSGTVETKPRRVWESVSDGKQPYPQAAKPRRARGKGFHFTICGTSSHVKSRRICERTCVFAYCGRVKHTPAHRGRGSGFAYSGTAATAPQRIEEGVALYDLRNKITMSSPDAFAKGLVGNRCWQK